MTEAEIGALIRDYGLLVIAPLALLEGPLVSVASGYLAKAGLVPLQRVFAVLVLADLAGDLVLYWIGRQGRAGLALPWLARIGVTRRRLSGALRAFRRNGGRLLVLGKLTHSAGFAVLLAAGMARMPVARFLVLNTVATVPKTAACVAVGWWFGAVTDRVGHWLAGGALLVLGFGLVLSVLYFRHRREVRK